MQDDSNLKPVYSRAFQMNSYSMYLSGRLEESEFYINWIHQINIAEPEDIINIYINSSGGDLMSAIQLAAALRDTQATVHTSISGDCCSSATMIFLCGDSMSIAPDIRFLIHNYSGGIYGKGHEIVAQSAFDEMWAKKLFENTYKHFLSPEEINAVLSSGKDMWMDADEVTLRCEILKEEREKENGNKENEQV